MNQPRDTAAAFDMIAVDIVSLLTLLGEAGSDAELAIVRDSIATLLDGVGLRWQDLAERVTASRTLEGKLIAASSSPALMPTLRPRSEIAIDPATVLSNDELQLLGGYRTAPDSTLGGFGYRDAPDTFEMIPGETNAEAGQRLAKWALDAEGVVYYENPQTGELHPPGWVIPSKGKVMPDGTLGPLPVQE